MRGPQKFRVIFHMIWSLQSNCQIKWKIAPNFFGLPRKAELSMNVLFDSVYDLLEQISIKSSLCDYFGSLFLFKLHSLEKIFHIIAFCVRFVWFEIYIFLHWNVNFEVAKIEEKNQMHRIMLHFGLWFVRYWNLS